MSVVFLLRHYLLILLGINLLQLQTHYFSYYSLSNHLLQYFSYTKVSLFSYISCLSSYIKDIARLLR